MTGVMSKITVGDSVALEGSDFNVTGYTDGDLSGQTLTGTRDVFVSKNFCKLFFITNRDALGFLRM